METEDQKLIEANNRLLRKREERKVMKLHIPLMENFNKTLEDVLDRLRVKANETGQNQTVLQETPRGNMAITVEPDSKKYQRWGIPKLYLECNFETFRGNDKLVGAIQEAIKSEEHIVLVGNTGCGKTHLAISAVKESNRSEHGKVFISTQELLLRIRESFREGSRETEADVIERYADCGVLVLDDLGAEKVSEYSITTLYLIIDRRMRDCRPTIITTNMGLKQIEEKLSARIASRLSSMKVFKINMPDFRKKR